MALFGIRGPQPPKPPAASADLIPIMHIDLTKRYDVYCTVTGEERLYENVRFIAIRTFERQSEYSSGLIGGYLEIETADGAKMLIPSYGIQLLCEHGMQPAFRVLRSWGNSF
jgi:hypothetical protein